MAVRLAKRSAALAAAAVAIVFVLGAAPACASSVWWGLTSGSRPTDLPLPGGTGQIVVTAENRGYTNAEGGTDTIVLTDKLPSRLKAVSVDGIAGETGSFGRGLPVCVQPAGPCEFKGKLPPYEEIELRISVEVLPGAQSGEENEVSVAGGGAIGTKTLREPDRIAAGATPFGVEDYQLIPEEEGGGESTQAGAHPFQLTSVLTLNTSKAYAELKEQEPAGLTKDLSFQLPAGLIGNPTPFLQCTDAQFTTRTGPPGYEIPECAQQTVVGVAATTFNSKGGAGGFDTVTEPIYNTTPLPGEPARFGLEVAGNPVFLDTSVRTGRDYGVTVNVNDVTELAGFLGSKVTFWGVPGDPRHDRDRGAMCVREFGECKALNELGPPPFLSLPTGCAGPLHTSVQVDSWIDRGVFLAPVEASNTLTGMDGCDALPFAPELSVAPDSAEASTPTGLTVKVHLPQDATLNAKGLAESALRDTTVALPEGLALNAGGADGLEACSEEQMGFQAGESAPERLVFTPAYPDCPDASKIGTVKIGVPILAHPLEGAVYLANQDANPFGSLIAMYIVADDPVSGVLVKLAGEVSLSESGQIVSTFKNSPDAPLEDLELHFFGGARAPLSTPTQCGSYETRTSLTPWSGNPPATPSSTFQIVSGPNGGPCLNPPPFSPSLTAGSTNIQAGAFSPFTMTMSREDGNQNLQAIRLHMPPGLLGTLSSVELCPEPQASLGTCGPNSLIGETTVSVGVGGNPYSVKGGRVYITGPYEGAPFGLSIVNPAKAGPFDLEKDKVCDCVAVRAKIEVDPTTAALTVTSDDTGPFEIPHILKGIPLQIQHVNVTINRPGFTLNPTNCAPMAITGALQSVEGATSSLSVPFQATNCATLAFKPQFKVSTSGKTSRSQGASLDVKLSYPRAPWGTQANIRSVKVNLPKQLPSRLTTLQKACPDRMFNANPAACPAASRIGTATSTTPIIPVLLSGPAYFVSHGGAKFPELIVVLQGYGVTIDLHGETFISKTGITSSTFRTVPDVPVSTFELKLPQGPYSALGSNANLCKVKGGLKMPTAFTAQNGAVIHQSTSIAVSGCPKTKKANKKSHKRPRGKGAHRERK
jgi:hypothetical protein